MSSPVGEEHDESVDDVVITTQREVLVILIIGRKRSKWNYTSTKITTINHKRPPIFNFRDEKE